MDKRILSVMVIAILSMILLAGCAQEPIGEATAAQSPFEPGKGGILVSTTPKLGGAHVVLSQSQVDKYSFDTRTSGTSMGSMYQLNVPAGTYTVTVTLNGYQTSPKQVSIAAGQYRLINFQMTASPTTGTGGE